MIVDTCVAHERASAGLEVAEGRGHRARGDDALGHAEIIEPNQGRAQLDAMAVPDAGGRLERGARARASVSRATAGKLAMRLEHDHPPVRQPDGPQPDQPAFIADPELLGIAAPREPL
jgi:hypothetical protein